MIAPCPDCEGSGLVYNPAPPGLGEAMPCPTCVDMPALKPDVALNRWWVHTSNQYSVARLIWGRGWFKPDPSTVMRWCKTHKSVAYINPRDARPLSFWWCEYVELGNESSHDCDLAWVAAITEAEVMVEVTP